MLYSADFLNLVLQIYEYMFKKPKFFYFERNFFFLQIHTFFKTLKSKLNINIEIFGRRAQKVSYSYSMSFYIEGEYKIEDLIYSQSVDFFENSIYIKLLYRKLECKEQNKKTPLK